MTNNATLYYCDTMAINIPCGTDYQNKAARLEAAIWSCFASSLSPLCHLFVILSPLHLFLCHLDSGLK